MEGTGVECLPFATSRVYNQPRRRRYLPSPWTSRKLMETSTYKVCVSLWLIRLWTIYRHNSC